MSDYSVPEPKDIGQAAQFACIAAILFARVSGFNAENELRHIQESMPAYTDGSYESEIQDALAALKEAAE